MIIYKAVTKNHQSFPYVISWVTLIAILWISPSLHAEVVSTISSEPDQNLSILFKRVAQQHPEVVGVAGRRQWHQLLHYRQHHWSLSHRYRSQNDDANFFLHPQGQWDPKAELIASIVAMTQYSPAINPHSSEQQLTQAEIDQSAQCRFPARFYWLKQQLPNLPWVEYSCVAFVEWQALLQAHSLTLIFPASHINSPSSMYGHTLLRLDKQDPTASKLLSQSVNFAAHHDPTDGELVFSYKGLTGGYPGRISVAPYYVKTNQYQKMEYRDTWEYALSFEPHEVAQFVRHVWELQDSSFDYFFFDENCSYRLLAMLDASSERSNLADQFKFKAIPVDTVRALYEAEFVENSFYRPSAASDMEWAAGQVEPIVNQVARRLVDQGRNSESLWQNQANQQQEIGAQSNPSSSIFADRDIAQFVEGQLVGLSVQQQSQALDLAVAYARYLVVKKKYNQTRLRPLTLALLSARSQRPTVSSLLATPTPQYRDDQGHASQRVKIALVNRQQKVSEQNHSNVNQQPTSSSASRDGVSKQDRTLQSIDLGFRFAFHDITDPVNGFVGGSQIEMGHATLRLTQVKDDYAPAFRDYSSSSVQLQQLTLVDVLSLTPFTRYQSPISWGVRASLERDIVDRGLYGQFGARVGRSWRVRQGQLFSVVHSQISADNQFEDGYRLQLGADVGWLYQGQHWQALAQWQWRPISGGQLFGWGEDSRQTQLQLFAGYRLSRNLQLGLQYDYQQITEFSNNSEINHRAQQWQLQLARFF